MTEFIRKHSPHAPAALRIMHRKPLALLEIRRGMAKNKMRPVVGPVFLIGGSAECDLVLADPQFPEIHAYLLVNHGRISLRRVGEGPELTVDGRAVEAAKLFDGDLLRTGPYEFRLHLVSPGDPDYPREEPSDEKPSLARSTHRAEPAPQEIVRALVAEIRARLAGQTSAVVHGASSPVNGREAA